MRRQFTRAATAIVCLLAGACSGPGRNTNPDVVVVHLGGGQWGEANVAAYAKPFEAETGIKVIGIVDDFKIANLKLMKDTGNVEIDVISLPAIESARAGALGYLSPIAYSQFTPEELAGMSDTVRKPWGIGSVYYSMILAHDAGHFPQSGAVPREWRDLWDVERFPGARTLYTGQWGDGPWEEALIADGVPLDKLYPLDIDRVFRSLERIRPHIIKWWRTGAEGQQLFRDRQVALGGVYDGRIADLRGTKSDIRFSYHQAKLHMDYWVIPKDAPHAANAQKFVAFATRARQQAIFAQKIAYGPTNLGAYRHIPEERARILPSHPDNIAQQFEIDVEWYVRPDAHGVSNFENLIHRWNGWILQ